MPPITRSSNKRKSNETPTLDQPEKVVKKAATEDKTTITPTPEEAEVKAENDTTTVLDSEQEGSSQSNNEPVENDIIPTSKSKDKEPKTKKEPKAKKEPVPKKEPKAKKEPVPKKEPKAKKEPAPKKVPKAKKEPAPKKESKAKKGTAAKEVKPKVNAKEKRRKIKASEIPGFETLNSQTASRVVRVLTQRMFILSRNQHSHHKETFEVLGSIGTKYTVSIDNVMSCTCVDYRLRRGHCKHILMVLSKVYRLHFSNPFYHSLYTTETQREEAMNNNLTMVDTSLFVSDEIRQKIMNVVSNNPNPDTSTKAERRPLDTSDCPVCFEEFEPENINFIDYCSSCGNNIHKQCIQLWIDSKGGPNNATCVYCRAKWFRNQTKTGMKHISEIDPSHREGGFVNFADELNIRRTRDQSTYGDRYLDFIE